jgi:hypothetical protein
MTEATFRRARSAHAKDARVEAILRSASDQARQRGVRATSTGMAGALWQMAAPGTAVRSLFETDPQLAHAVVDVRPRLTNILSALIAGYLAA